MTAALVADELGLGHRERWYAALFVMAFDGKIHVVDPSRGTLVTSFDPKAEPVSRDV